jgi:hypothetical protein
MTVIVVAKIIAAPLVYAFAHRVKAETVGLACAGSRRAAGFTVNPRIESFPRRRVAPGIKRTRAAAPRGALPFSLRRQAKNSFVAVAQPPAVSHRIVPSDADHRLLRMAKPALGPKRWRRGATVFNVKSIFLVTDGKFADTESIEPNAVNRSFIFLSLVGSHQKASGGN